MMMGINQCHSVTVRSTFLPLDESEKALPKDSVREQFSESAATR